MLNGNEWHQLHSDFLNDSHRLLHRADECLSHLEMINDDKDAIEALLGALQRIAGKADAAGVAPVAGFSRQLRYLLYFAGATGRLQPKALVLLRQCLSLLSWQIELVDPLTGVLPLDEHEQHELLEQFGCCCGIGALDNSYSGPVDWPAPLKLVNCEPAPDEHLGRSSAL